MKPGTLAALLLVLGAAAGGYWAGQRHTSAAQPTTSAASSGKAGERKLLYYRNPMGLPDTSPVPKKDPMGMDYVPVYEGEDSAAGSNAVKVSADKVQALGVRTEAVARRALVQTVRATGRIEVDERRTVAVTPRFEGYIERLLVNATGQAVAKGQPLFEVYSPELVAAQREYFIAAQGEARLANAGDEAKAGARKLAEASLARLRTWGLDETTVAQLAQAREVQRTVTLRAPAAGVVSEKKALQGMRFMPGEMLYQITDLSSVWVIADVFEQDLAQLRPGVQVKLRVNAYAGREFEGRIGYVYPTLNAETRTVPVRVELANPGGLLKPGMYAEMSLPAGDGAAVLTVPASAVIDSGTRQVVLVAATAGRFAPRAVKLGRRAGDHLEIREGLEEGEQVVVAANFLIDAESNLKAALSSFGGGGEHADHGANKAAVSHRTTGKVESLDATTKTAMISHAPVASLKWPAMTMEFKASNDALWQSLKAGASIEFEFVERAPGEWVVVAIKAAPAAAAGHSGH